LLASLCVAACVASACVGDDGGGSDASKDTGCSVGSEGCPCTSGGACNPGLACKSNVCVNLGDDSGPDVGPSDAPADTPSDKVDAVSDAPFNPDANCLPLGSSNCQSNAECCSNYCSAGVCVSLD
jgi:hypothetical protein